MSDHVFEFDATLWLHDGEAPWHFVTLPTDVADAVADLATAATAFGSVPVEVTIGATTWQTSLFPDKKSASYVLAVKKSVRLAEGLGIDDSLHVQIRPLARGEESR